MNFQTFSAHQMQSGVQPSELVPFIGKTVRQAWATRRMIAVLFTDDWLFYAQPMPAEGPQVILKFHVGTIKPGLCEGLDEVVPSSRYTESLKGRRFTGIEESVITFDHAVGVHIRLDRLDWVRKREEKQ